MRAYQYQIGKDKLTLDDLRIGRKEGPRNGRYVVWLDGAEAEIPLARAGQSRP